MKRALRDQKWRREGRRERRRAAWFSLRRRRGAYRVIAGYWSPQAQSWSPRNHRLRKKEGARRPTCPAQTPLAGSSKMAWNFSKVRESLDAGSR